MAVHLLDISHNSHKFLNKLPPEQFRQIGRALFGLTKNPCPTDSEHLIGYSGYMRKDVREYRIIYYLTNKIVKILLVGTRNVPVSIKL